MMMQQRSGRRQQILFLLATQIRMLPVDVGKGICSVQRRTSQLSVAPGTLSKMSPDQLSTVIFHEPAKRSIRSHNSPSLAIPKHPGGKLLAAAQIAKRILTERRKWRSFFPDLYPQKDQRWLSKDFMVPFRSISSPHPWFGQVSNIHWDAILHATRPSPPWSPCLWLNFGSGCASDEFQKVENSWGINERHFKKSNKPPRHTYFYTHLVEIY